ncbi:DUF4897 domain-containing protein [Mesoaciditoga sp.]
MSKYNKLLWIVVAALAGVMVFQFFFMKRKTPYHQTYYRSEYVFSNDSTAVTIRSVAKFSFDKVGDMKKAIDQFEKMTKSDKLKAYKEMFKNLSKNTKVNIEVLDYKSTMTTFGSTGLKIDETGVIAGIIKRDGKKMSVGMGNVEMKLDGNSEVIFSFPENVKIISVSPTPTLKRENELIWKGPMNLKFPEVEYVKP